MAKELDIKVDYIQDKVDEVANTVHKIDKEQAVQRAAFDEHLVQDERMYQEFKRNNDILQDNTASLREHMHRTDMLEELMLKMDARFTPVELKFTKEQAIGEYRAERKKKIKGLLVLTAKIIGTITAVIGLILTIRSMHGH